MEALLLAISTDDGIHLSSKDITACERFDIYYVSENEDVFFDDVRKIDLNSISADNAIEKLRSLLSKYVNDVNIIVSKEIDKDIAGIIGEFNIKPIVSGRRHVDEVVNYIKTNYSLIEEKINENPGEVFYVK